jgi:hypothetical protein
MHSCLILGSGRSGTSLLGGILHQSGYYMGERLYQPNESNPKGFFENKEINGINEAILSPYGGSPFSRTGSAAAEKHSPENPGRNQHWLLSIPPSTTVTLPDPSLAERITAALSREPFAFKDPRFSYTLPVWKEHLPEGARLLCVFRHPSVTVDSILKECGRREYLRDMSIDHRGAFGLWFNVYSHVLKHFEADRGPFLFVHYEQILDRSALVKLAGVLEAGLDKDFPDRGLNRSRAAFAVPDRVKVLYNTLCRLAEYEPSAPEGETGKA